VIDGYRAPLPAQLPAICDTVIAADTAVFGHRGAVGIRRCRAVRPQEDRYFSGARAVLTGRIDAARGAGLSTIVPLIRCGRHASDHSAAPPASGVPVGRSEIAERHRPRDRATTPQRPQRVRRGPEGLRHLRSASRAGIATFRRVLIANAAIRIPSREPAARPARKRRRSRTPTATPHVRAADRAVHVGPAPSAQSYLDSSHRRRAPSTSATPCIRDTISVENVGAR
jgi:hypothetical protein